MYLKPFKNFTYSIVFQALRREENKDEVPNLNFSPFTSILLNFFLPLIDIACFILSLKLQHCRTIILLNKRQL